MSFTIRTVALVLGVFGLMHAVTYRRDVAFFMGQRHASAPFSSSRSRSAAHGRAKKPRSAKRRTLAADGQPIGTTFFRRSALARRIKATSPPLDADSRAMIEAVSSGGLGRLQFDRAGNGGTAVSTGHRFDQSYTPQCLAHYGPPGNPYGCAVSATHVRAGATDGVPTDYHSAFLDASNNGETDAWLTCATEKGGNLQGNPCTFPLPGPLRIGWGASGSRSGDGTGFGGTAASIALTPGLVRAEDLLAGVDTHGFLVAVQCGAPQAHVYPAQGTDALGASTCTGATAEPRYGQILWLDAAGESEMLTMNPGVLRPYIRAWHDFGAYIGDKNEAGTVSAGSDAITVELENSPAWLRVISSIRCDRHPLDMTVANGSFHINPRVPRDFLSHLHVLSTSCSTAGC